MKRDFLKVKKGVLGRRIGTFKNWSLTDAQREKPNSDNSAWDTAAEMYNTGTDWYGATAIDAAGPVMDAVGGFTDFAGDGKDRGWGLVGKADGKWGDGEGLQGLPFAGAILKSIDCIFQAAAYIKDMVHFAKDNKDSSNTTTSEKWEVFQKTADMTLTLLDTVASWIGAFTTFAGRIPIIGAVIGAVGAGISFVMNAIQLHKARVSISRMRKQKTSAKERIRSSQGDLKDLPGTTTPGGGQGANPADVTFAKDKTVVKGVFNKKTERKFKITRSFEKVKGKNPKIDRDMRLDEKTKEMRSGQKGGEKIKDDKKEEAVQALEDYDVTKELTGANKKRRREGIVNLILQDAVGFATSLASLDPTGMGSGIGAGINAAVGIGMLGKKVTTSVRQLGRNQGWEGFDQNKSTENKEQRRHNLAVVMFDRIVDLGKYEFDKINPEKTNEVEFSNVEKGIPHFEDMDDRITAMGVAGPLLRAGNAVEMVKVMRQGFYRDSNG